MTNTNTHNRNRDILLIILFFIISRIIVTLLGIRMNQVALYLYWQYLDVETLRHHLMLGVWYDHAQPPVFNILLGLILKLTGSGAPFVFEWVFKLISLINSLLILSMLKEIGVSRMIALFLSLLYLLSPATLLYETELFYTTFISLFLLLTVRSLIKFEKTPGLRTGWGIFIPLAITCLTRSMYHILWFFLVIVLVFLHFRKRKIGNTWLLSAIAPFLIVFCWYLKNWVIFGTFSASTWIGMNFARNVFHDNIVTDSSKIEAYSPFSKISTYQPFISGELSRKFSGVNDRDLLKEFKNDSFVNENHIDYIEVSKKYMDASKQYVKQHPIAYLKNVAQSSLIFFTSATRYPMIEDKSDQIRYYDIIYSFNLSHFAKGKEQRRIALALSAIPKLIIYLLVFYLIIRTAIRTRDISLYNLFIIFTILFVFGVSTLLEHYENMRFRYEIEPLFLLLAGQALSVLAVSRKDAR
ncbi:MAG: hypothetical protein C5B59_01655 [Bacteroidetes bacterium]|nr:MAG: hypothetical protein C5B59_01655 [Bacteroidota bacterium]